MCTLFLLVSMAQPAIIHVYPAQWAGWVPAWLMSSGDEITQDVGDPGLADLVSQTGASMLRWGGIAAEYWDWEGFDYEGSSFVDFYGSGIIETPTPCSVDDLLQFCESAGVEPIMTVNHQIDDPGKAARLVEYCNGGIGTPMGALRAQRGHPEPYDVTFWCIGNEPDIAGNEFPTPFGTWTFYRHFGIPFEEWGWTDSVFCTAEQFSGLVGGYVEVMRAASPIPLSIGGLSLAGDDSWIAPVIGPNIADIDWMDAHYYPVWTWESDSSMYHDLLWAPDSSTAPLEDRYSYLRTQLDAVPGGSGIPLWILEYNVAVMAGDPVWWNYLDGLVIADCIGHLAHAGAPAAAVYSIAEGSPGEFPLFGQLRTDTLSARMGAFVLELYAEHFGGTLVETDCSGSKPYGLEAWSSITDEGAVAVIVVNRELDAPVQAHIELHGWVPGSSFDVWQITNDAPMQAPFNGTTGIVFAGTHDCGASGVDWLFPQASVTCLRIAPTMSAGEEEPGCEPLRATPSPSSGTVLFSFEMQAPGLPPVLIFDSSGRLVRRLEGDRAQSGSHGLVWDGLDGEGAEAPTGCYAAVLDQPGTAGKAAEFVLLR